jgi:hypothetical protein
MRGVLRGIQYQFARPQGELVRVVSGSVFDVAVDLRKTSANVGRWIGVELSADNRRQFWIPAGFGLGLSSAASGQTFAPARLERNCGLWLQDPESLTGAVSLRQLRRERVHEPFDGLPVWTGEREEIRTLANGDGRSVFGPLSLRHYLRNRAKISSAAKFHRGLLS